MVILETARLTLRTFRADDLPGLSQLYADSDVRRYFPEGVLTEQETREELEWYLNGGWPDHPRLGLWAAIDRQTDRFVGRCGLIPWTIDDRLEIELAYLIAKDYWRQGLATEAAEAIVHYAFNELRFTRLIALIDEMNVASIRTAERVGFRFEREVVIDGTRAQLFALGGIPSPSSIPGPPA